MFNLFEDKLKWREENKLFVPICYKEKLGNTLL
jgi:hypothetical protein